MLIGFAKDVILKNHQIHCKLDTMDDETKEVLFFHFYNCPIQISFTREDGFTVKMTVRKFVSILPQNADGANRLVGFFLKWKAEYFDRFDKKVVDFLSDNPGRNQYLFLRSSTFLNNRESWEKDGMDNSKDKILESYSNYLNRCCEANKALGEYYLIKDRYDSKILANKFTHQLYDLRETMVVAGFAGGVGFSLVPLMVKYEDVYETPIEEHEIWDGKLWGSEGRMLKFSVLLCVLFKIQLLCIES